MQTSDKGIAFLVSHEGIVPAPYRDSVGVLTYGVGHTKAAGAPDPSSLPRGMPNDLDAALEDVFDVFKGDLQKYEREVLAAFSAPLTQAQFDAAVSFHYNTGAIGRASWVKMFNQGNVSGAGGAIMNWKRPAEIIPRRKAEQALFRTGEYGETSATVWGVSGERIVWKPVRKMTGREIVEMMRGPVAPVYPQKPEKPAGGLLALLKALFGGLK